MSILSCLKTDIEELVNSGFYDKEIAIAVDTELKTIQPVINYYRRKVCNKKLGISSLKINTMGNNKGVMS